MLCLKKFSLAAAMLCSAASGTAFAQNFDYNPSWYIAPSLNLLYPDAGFQAGDRGEGAAIRFGKPLSETWDVQLGTSYAHARGDGMTYQQNLLGADALYMFSRKEFRPFVLVGLGYQEDRLSSALGQAGAYAPFVNAGLGFQLSFNDQWAMQADFRRVHGYLHDTDLPIDRSSNNYLNIGLVYSFGKSATRAVGFVPTPAPIEVAEAAPAPPPPPAPRFEKVTFSSTELFAFDKSELRMPQPKLDDLANALNANAQINNVVITGYTDRIGSDRYNQKLSERRAAAVDDYLVSKGVSASRLSAVGRGKGNPIVVCTETKRAALIECLEPNRRVEVEQVTIEKRIN